MLEKQYKPLIKELRKTSTPDATVKNELKEKPMDYEETDVEQEDTPTAASTPKPTGMYEYKLETVLSTPEGIESTSRYIDDHFKYPLANKYMNILIRDKAGKRQVVDNIYGPRYDNDTYTVDASPLEFSPDGDILINSVRYRSTEGLYELLFKRILDTEKYDDSDLNAYRNILLKTSAHKKVYEWKGPINSNVSKKYKEIISKLFPPPYVRVKGMMWKNTRSRYIVHWDDPNEVVDRL